MKPKTTKLGSAVVPKSGALRLQGTAIPTLGQGLVLVRTGTYQKVAAVTRPADEAQVVVAKAGKALNRPGIDKQKVVFRSAVNGKIFAYSIYANDPTKVVREASDGTQRVGRLVNGKFKAT